MSNFKAVIFDFNGTLFLDNDKHVLAWGKMSKLIRHKDLTIEELHEHCNGIPNKQVVNWMFNGECDEATMEKYSYLKEEYYRDFCKADTENFHLIAGAEQYFDKLKAEAIPFTIASASIKPNIDFFVDNFHLDKWIDYDKIIYDDGSYENKVAMFKKAAEVLNVETSDCLIIEDSISGIRSGYEAGCRNIIVLDSAHAAKRYKDLAGVNKIINDFNEM